MIFCAAAIIPNLFPAWVTSGATVLTFALGGGSVVLISIVALIFIIGFTLTLSPVIYQTVEKIELFKAGAVILFLVVAVLGAISLEAYGDLSQVVTNFGRVPEGLPPALVLSGIAAAGAGCTIWCRATGSGTRVMGWAP